MERVRKRLEATDAAGDLATRRAKLSKRLAARQAEKNRYVGAYAQNHASEEDLDVYLVDLKNRTDNLRLLLPAPVWASQRREQAGVADSPDSCSTRCASARRRWRGAAGSPPAPVAGS